MMTKLLPPHKSLCWLLVHLSSITPKNIHSLPFHFSSQQQFKLFPLLCLANFTRILNSEYDENDISTESHFLHITSIPIYPLSHVPTFSSICWIFSVEVALQQSPAKHRLFPRLLLRPPPLCPTT